MDINCELIKDLMPLYVEGLCSDYTKEIVEEHIKTCQNCKQIFDTLVQQDKSEMSKQDVKRAVNPFKKIKKRNFIKTAIIVACVICVGFAANYTYLKLFVLGFTAPTSILSVMDIKKLDEMTFELEVSTNEKSKIISYVSTSHDDKGVVYLRVNYLLNSPFNSLKLDESLKLSIGFDEEALGSDKIRAIYLTGEDSDDVKLIWEE